LPNMIMMVKKQCNSDLNGGKRGKEKGGLFYFIMTSNLLRYNFKKEACPKQGWPLLTYEKHLQQI